MTAVHCCNAGMQLDKQGTSSAPLLSNSKQSCPPLFRSPAASGDWSIGTVTPVLQVLPRHRRSAAAAAEAMLSNGSPLSGLHKLALSICARKKGTVAAVEPSALPAKTLGGTNDKENLSPVLKMQSRKPLGKQIMYSRNTQSVTQVLLDRLARE